MKTAAVRKLRRKLAADAPVFGLWVTLEAASVTEMAVALGLDWVVIDAEHGHLDWKEIVEHLRATTRSDTVAFVRITELNGGLIKRALDLGADGVVVPWVETAEQLRRAVAFACYPPEGRRGIGAERATAWGQCLVEHTAEANEHVLVVPIIESVATVAEVPAMCAVEGVELFYFGPADFSATAGFRGLWEGPGVADQILAMKDVIRRSGKHCGVVAKGADDLKQRLEQGFRMLAMGIDAGLMIRSLRAMLASAGRDRPMRADLTVVDEPKPPAPLPRPPESMRPDRPEVMTPVGSGPLAQLATGVRFECLVGAPNQARNLTTGLVTFDPEAALPYHTHPFSEVITLLHGQASVEIEGRCYELGQHDNIVIPRGTAHSSRNTSRHEAAVFHIAMATDNPTRTLVNEAFPRQLMPATATGRPGRERVNRFPSAPRFAAGPNTEFIDFFNSNLVPGIEMSGGFGLFHCGGRLPAHVHDFDESICIIAGTATCIVEGRRYSLSGGATAMVPRGRVHYFINEIDAPMAMVWVYAGPMPERIIVDERCATVAGNPWK
jgi:2-keto-3-deoxy-L-rhamnonate aldolase RhmA/quercetin dioxygenase-like cupin family protein